LANISKTVLDVFKMLRIDKGFRFDDDDPELLGSGVPIPKPPGSLDGHAAPPSE